MRAGIWRAVHRSVHVRVEEIFTVTTPAVFLMRAANFKMETMSANQMVNNYRTGLWMIKLSTCTYTFVYKSYHIMNIHICRENTNQLAILTNIQLILSLNIRIFLSLVTLITSLDKVHHLGTCSYAIKKLQKICIGTVNNSSCLQTVNPSTPQPTTPRTTTPEPTPPGKLNLFSLNRNIYQTL